MEPSLYHNKFTFKRRQFQCKMKIISQSRRSQRHTLCPRPWRYSNCSAKSGLSGLLNGNCVLQPSSTFIGYQAKRSSESASIETSRRHWVALETSKKSITNLTFHRDLLLRSVKRTVPKNSSMLSRMPLLIFAGTVSSTKELELKTIPECNRAF